jgi:serine/threonine protein kinase/tetratricopeptide (TPR) repeat protein
LKLRVAMPTNLPKARELFLHAVGKLPPEQWEAFLVATCGADADLAQLVRDLLQAHREAGSFLDAPAPGLDATLNQPPLERIGTTIGPYKLLQQIGEGGMGVVYMAEQHEPVKRRVALKIIKPGMDTRQVIARFEAERQALSLMDHPNIAKVLDAGTTERGRPYFVMELVKGQPITQYCDEKHLTPRQRLELLLPVCQAIQHAHQKGIIHRDIKPTNILVAEYDQQPVPKVIDFGVAKAISQSLTEKTMFTGLGQIVGTLEYMSPEQAKVNQLDIDTRSDIYSLGVLLYELLTGSTPFDRHRLRSAAFDEMLRIIREEEPPKPSTRLSDSKDSLPSVSAQRQTEPAKLTKLVRGELDWIVMKALEKDRSLRYEAATGLAADIQHYLNDEPVIACPPSAAYRFRKFAQRNRAALVTASLLTAVILVGAAVSVWQAVRATHAEGVAEAEAERAGREASRANSEADRANTEAQKAKNEAAIAQAVNDFLTNDLLAQGSPLHEPDRDIKLRTIVDRAAANIEGRFREQPVVEAHIRNVVGETYFHLGRWGEAEAQLRRALKIRRERPEAAHLDTAHSSDLLGLVLQGAGRPAEAEPLHKEALAVRERLLGPRHGGTLESASNLGRAISSQGRYAEAEKLLHDVCEVSKCEFGPEHPATLKNLNLYANHKYKQGNRVEAEKLLREILEVRRRVLRPEHPQTLGVMHSLASQLREQGRSEEAAELFREVLNGQRRVLGSEHPRTLTILVNLGRELSTLGRHVEAVPLFEELYQAQRRFRGPGDAETLKSMDLLAREMKHSGLHDKRERLFRGAVQDFIKLIEDEPEVSGHRNLLAETLKRLGDMLTLLKRTDEAEHAYRQSIVVLEKLARDFPARADYRQRLGNTYLWSLSQLDYVAGRPPNAEPIRQALAISEKLAADFPELASNWANLGVAHLRSGNWDQGVACLSKAIDIEPDDWIAWHHRGYALSTAGQWEKAAADLTRAVELNPKHWWNWYRRGQVYSGLRQWEKANADYARAIEQGSADAEVWLSKGTAELNLGDLERAINDYGIAVGMNPYTANGAFEALRAAERLPEAEKLLRQALALFEKRAADLPTEPNHRKGIAEIRNRLGQVLRMTHPENAEKEYRQAIVIYEGLVSDSSPGQDEFGEGLGHSYRLLADVLGGKTRADEREKLWRQAAKQFEALLAKATPHPRREFHRFDLADTYRSLADGLVGQMRTAEAETFYRKALDQFALTTAEVLRSPTPDFAWHRDALNQCFANLTNLLMATGRTQDVEQVCQTAISLYTRLAAESPDEPYFHEELDKRQAELKKLMDQQ